MPMPRSTNTDRSTGGGGYLCISIKVQEHVLPFVHLFLTYSTLCSLVLFRRYAVYFLCNESLIGSIGLYRGSSRSVLMSFRLSVTDSKIC